MVLCFLSHPADGWGDKAQHQLDPVFASSLYMPRRQSFRAPPPADCVRCHRAVSHAPGPMHHSQATISEGKLPTFLMSAPSVAFPPWSFPATLAPQCSSTTLKAAGWICVPSLPVCMEDKGWGLAPGSVYNWLGDIGLASSVYSFKQFSSKM